MTRSYNILLLVAVWLLSATPAFAVLGSHKPKFAGPYEAIVISVHDGDTIKAWVYAWPGSIQTVSVRIRGIDTPEIKGKCGKERDQAQRARSMLKSIAAGAVTLRNVSLGKYAGRVIADVETLSGDAGRFMIQSGLARSYRGGKRRGWCE